MGIWGTGLYQDDISADVKDFYKEQLRMRKSTIDIKSELLSKYEDVLDDPYDASVFWFALADTQWEFGRLEGSVKEKALFYIDKGYDLKRWEEEWPQKAKSRANVLIKLKQKLLSPQPPVKKISIRRIYHCKWNTGDVFAYRIKSDTSELSGKIFLIQKVDETVWYPGHIVPIVYVKITEKENLPSDICEYNELEYIQTGFTRYEDRFLPIDVARAEEDIAEKSNIRYEVDDFGFLPEYRIILLSTSQKVVPSNLIYIGNFPSALTPKKEFIPHSKEGISAVKWKDFESAMIDRYLGYNLRRSEIYSKKDKIKRR